LSILLQGLSENRQVFAFFCFASQLSLHQFLQMLHQRSHKSKLFELLSELSMQKGAFIAKLAYLSVQFNNLTVLVLNFIK